MKYRVKIICADDVDKLEEKVNKWLDEQKDIHIQDIRYEVSPAEESVKWNTALILYRRGLVYTSGEKLGE